MGLFKKKPDATDNKSCAKAIQVMHHVHNDLFDTIGIKPILPSPVKGSTGHVNDKEKRLLQNARQELHEFKQIFKKRKRDPDDSPDFGSKKRKHHQGEDVDEDEDDEDQEQDSANRSDDRGPYRDPPDDRDYHFMLTDKPLGHCVDLRDKCPQVYDQGASMSCTAHAVAGAFEFDILRQGLPRFKPSRLFIWYNSRAKSAKFQAVKKDIGCCLRDAIKSLDFETHGICSESDWPYEVCKSNKKTYEFVRRKRDLLKKPRAAKRPPIIAEKHAHERTTVKYMSFTKDDLEKKLIQCLDEGYPFIFGMMTYDQLKKVGKDGHGLTLPTAKDKERGEHRHSLLAVGYIQDQKAFIVRNSWGLEFGENGYFYMPYTYLEYCYDFWTIRVVTAPVQNPSRLRWLTTSRGQPSSSHPKASIISIDLNTTKY